MKMINYYVFKMFAYIFGWEEEKSEYISINVIKEKEEKKNR